jgi:hypothetical protein
VIDSCCVTECQLLLGGGGWVGGEKNEVSECGVLAFPNFSSDVRDVDGKTLKEGGE